VSLWDNPKIGPSPLPEIKPLSAKCLAEALRERRKTHCVHGKPHGEHCPWCYVQTDEYRQSVARAMGQWLP
jgi:hypothetical protein